MIRTFLTFFKRGRQKQSHSVADMSQPSACVIALVSCVKQKRDRPAPARDLYVSTLFSLSRKYAEAHSDRWFILSAKYGLVQPEQVIEPYEETLRDKRREDRRAWALRVHEQLRDVCVLHDGVTFIWLAGQTYQGDLARLLSDYPQSDPLQGLPFGKRLAWLKERQATSR